MKKKLILVLMIGTFLLAGEAKATNYSKKFNINHDVYKFFNTYIKKELNGQSETFRYEPMFRSDGYEAYSMQPFKVLKENENYEFTTENIPEKLGISEDVWRDVELIMHYGYGYEKHNYLPWLAVTQLLVWRTIEPSGVFEFTTTDSYNNYQKEMQELTTLVEAHKKGPDFGGEEFSLKLGEELILTDSTEKLSEYSLSNTDGISTDVLGNKITINGLKSGLQELKITKSFPKKKYEKTALYYDDEDSLMVAVANDLPDFKKTIKIMVTVGNINLDIKNDDNTYYNCVSDAKTIYGLYDGDELIETFEVDNTKSFTSKDLPAKTYQVKQISHACNVKKDNETYEVILSEKETNPHVTIQIAENAKELKIIKKSGNILETNAKFTIGDAKKNFTLTTNDSGEATIKMGYGNYTLKQVSGFKNYTMVPEQTVIINDATPDVYTIELDSSEILGSFTLNIQRGEHYYSNCSNTLETVYGLYDEKDNLIESFGALEDKTYTLNNLSLKKYYLKQISHACNDKMDSRVYEINLTPKKTNVELSLEVLENFVELTINKKYFNLKENKLTLEKDAVFEISDENNTFTLTTNSKGNAKIKLGYGNYTIEQISGKENYELVMPQTITIDENTPEEYLIELESGEILKNIMVMVRDEEGNPIKGAVIALYRGTRKAMELTTDEKGLVCFASLSLREYIIKEISLPEEYQKEYKSETLDLKEDAEIILVNKKIEIVEDNMEEETKKEEPTIKEDTSKPKEIEIPNTKADGDGKIIKLYSLLFTLILYTFYLKKV